MPAAASAAEPRRTLSNDALMPAPTTLTAPRSSATRTRSPKRAASASRTRASSCRFSREIDQRQPTVAARAAACRRRRARRATPSSSPAVARRRLEHEHVALAGDADDRARRCAAGSAGRPCRRPTDRRRAAASGRARVDGDPLLLRELDRLRVQDLGAGFGELLRLFVRQRADAASPPARRADRRCRRRRRPSRSRSTPRRAPPPSRRPSCRCRRGRAWSPRAGRTRPDSRR